MFERKEWVDCKTPEELGRVLKFLYDGERANLNNFDRRTFEVFARLQFDPNSSSYLDMAPVVENFGVYVPKKLLNAKGVRDAINSIKKGD